MPDVQLPLPQDLMLPTLRAAIELGGSASYPDIDDRALEIAAITEAQRAVVYDSDATTTGQKILHHIASTSTVTFRPFDGPTPNWRPATRMKVAAQLTV